MTFFSSYHVCNEEVWTCKLSYTSSCFYCGSFLTINMIIVALFCFEYVVLKYLYHSSGKEKVICRNVSSGIL